MQDGLARQLRLWEEVTAPSSNGQDFGDPAFAANKSRPIHRWVPWIAGFSGEFVKNALRRYLDRPGLVLDPFAGVGTTLVEALLLGHQAVGFEINPYAALACRVKTTAYAIAPEKLYSEMARFQDFYHSRVEANYTPHTPPPSGFKTRTPFYSPRVLRKVLIVQDFIYTIQDPDLQDLFRVAFASTMVRYSNYSYEPSLSRRQAVGKEEIEDFPVDQAILSKLMEMHRDILYFREHLPATPAQTRVINDTFFRYASYLPPESVDFLVTSPPYLNNYHYNRNTRPQLYWLGYAQSPRDLAFLETTNFGQYWQTVREKERIPLAFSLPDTDLEERLETLRSLHPERGIYGGYGWANYAASYFNDCYRFAQGIYDVLKPGGTALVVIGNSILQGILFPTDQYLGKIAEAAGLELVNIDVPRSTRVGNSIIRADVRVGKAQTTDRLYEAVVELRKR